MTISPAHYEALKRRRMPLDLPMLDDRELAWAAGFFDGEGTISVQVRRESRNSHARGLAIAVSQAGEYATALLDRFRKAVGAGRVYRTSARGRPSHHKIVYSWRVSRHEDIQHVVCLLWRYLGPAKRRQSLAVLELYNSAAHGNLLMTTARGRAMALARWGGRDA